MKDPKLNHKKHHWVLWSFLAVLVVLIAIPVVLYFKTTNQIKSANTGPKAAQQVKHEMTHNKYIPKQAKQYLDGADTSWNEKEKSIDVTLTPEKTQEVEQQVAKHPDMANNSKAEQLSKAQSYVASQNHLYDNIRVVDPQTGNVIIQVKDGNVIQMNTDDLNPDTLKNAKQE